MTSEQRSDSDDDLQAIIRDETEKEDVAEIAAKGVKRTSSELGLKSKKRGKTTAAEEEWKKSDYEKTLEKVVFGDQASLLEKFKESARERTTATSDGQKPKRQPVWQDSDDEEVKIGDVVRENNRAVAHLNKEKKYGDLLKSKFSKLQTPPKWANLDRERDEEEGSDEELLQTVGHLVDNRRSGLQPKNIRVKKLKDLNRSTYAEGVISSVQFHPSSTVALVAGSTGIASIYSIDGQQNDKLHNVQFKKFPIKCAKILPNGKEALLGSIRNFFFSYDLTVGQATRVFLPKIMVNMEKFEISPCGKYVATCGRFGEVHLIDARSKELIRNFKQENVCSDLQFTEDSRKLISHSESSEISIFDLRQERIEHVFVDEGCISGKTVALSPNNRMLAAGSREGVVNIYNYPDLFISKAPKPEKTIYNLTTSISDMKFNHTSELLAICSESIARAVKLVHFPTGTVFVNFPDNHDVIGSIKTLEFSPASGFLAMGNCTRGVPLFRLKHFKNY